MLQDKAGELRKRLDALRQLRWLGKLGEDWKEEDHPRGHGGRFVTSGSGGESSSSSSGESSSGSISGETIDRAFVIGVAGLAAMYLFGPSAVRAVGAVANRIQVAASPVKRVKWVEGMIDDIASQHEYDAAKITVQRKLVSFDAGGNISGLAAGMCKLTKDSSGQSGHITITAPALAMMTKKHAEGVIAHEIMHGKYQAYLEAHYPKELRIMSDRSVVDNLHAHVRDPEVMQAVDDYTRFKPHSDIFDELEATDGVSKYSKQYWKGYKAGNIHASVAIHETLAEMERLRRTTGRLSGSSVWRGLYHDVNANWARTHGKHNRRRMLPVGTLGKAAESDAAARRQDSVSADGSLATLHKGSTQIYITYLKGDGFEPCSRDEAQFCHVWTIPGGSMWVVLKKAGS